MDTVVHGSQSQNFVGLLVAAVVALGYVVYVFTKRGKGPPAKRTVAILVLGDIGRSPRMMYHAESFAKHNFETYLIGYGGELSCYVHVEKYTLCYTSLFRFAPDTFVANYSPCTYYTSQRGTSFLQEASISFTSTIKNNVTSLRCNACTILSNITAVLCSGTGSSF